MRTDSVAYCDPQQSEKRSPDCIVYLFKNSSGCGLTGLASCHRIELTMKSSKQILYHLHKFLAEYILTVLICNINLAKSFVAIFEHICNFGHTLLPAPGSRDVSTFNKLREVDSLVFA